MDIWSLVRGDDIELPTAIRDVAVPLLMGETLHFGYGVSVKLDLNKLKPRQDGRGVHYDELIIVETPLKTFHPTLYLDKKGGEFVIGFKTFQIAYREGRVESELRSLAERSETEPSSNP